MKTLKIISLLLIFFTFNFFNLIAQNSEEELDPMRFYKAKYELELKENINVVIEAVIEIFNELGCAIIQNTTKPDPDGYTKAIIKSDFCVIIEGKGSFDTLMYYSKTNDMPFIRGGIWNNGRIQYRFIIKENENGGCNLSLKATLSGLENNITHKVHFWESNGMLEHSILEAISEKVKLKTGQ